MINSTTIEFSVRNNFTDSHLKNPLYLLINVMSYKYGGRFYDMSLYKVEESPNLCEIDKADFIIKIVNKIAVRFQDLTT